MLTEEQIEARRSGLGGSDMAAVLGIDPYKQAIDVFYDKRPDIAAEAGYVPDVVEGDHVDFGNYVEEPVAQLYAKRMGVKVRRSNIHHQHKTAYWLKASIDRKVEGLQRGLECKSVNWRLADRWGEDGGDGVADYYMPQCFSYMLVLNYPAWDVAALIGGATDFRIYHLQRDQEWDDIILDGSRDFWLNHVEKGIPPAIDLEHGKAAETLRKAYSLVNDESITLPDDAVHWHRVMEDAKAQAKQYEAVAEGAKNHLLALAGNAAKIYMPGVKGAYLREKRHRDEYTVAASDYVQFRYSNRVK